MQITGGYLKSRKIDSPKTSNVRPTLSQIRESIFSILFSLIDFEGKDFLDAFAGSGIMGFEAISRGFQQAAFIEKDRKTFNLLKENAEKLDVKGDFYFGDSLIVLKKHEKTYDVIYIDPPYQSGLYEDILKIIKTNLKEGGIIILEHPFDLSLDFNGFEIIKQKNYSDKTITLLTSYTN